MPPLTQADSGTGRVPRSRMMSAMKMTMVLAAVAVTSADTSSKLPVRHRPRYSPMAKPTTAWTTKAIGTMIARPFHSE